MLWLRRAAGELLSGYQRQRAAASLLPPVSAAALQQARTFAASQDGQVSEHAQSSIQPFSMAMKQLEEAVSDPLLPTDAAASNRRSLATLKEFATSLSSSPTGYPPAAVKNVQFVFKDPYADGKLQRVRCQLKTTGGNCAHLVQQNLGQLLARLGLNPYFYFDGDQFRPKASPKPQVVPKPAQQTRAARSSDPTPEEVEAVRARAAAAGFPSQRISEQQFREMEQQSEAGRAAKAKAAQQAEELANRMKKIDPLFAAVAAVPWLIENNNTEDKVGMIKSKVMDEIESWGWDIRGAVHKIWAGERRLEVLQQGKDVGSQLAIKGIMFHTVQNDKKYGRVTHGAL